MDKKGEKLMVFWWFLACMIVFLVLILTTINFFAKPIDTREIQTQITFSNLYSCLVKDSYLIPEVVQKDFDLTEYCNLRSSESMQDLQFFIQVDFIDQESKNSLLDNPLKVGDGSLLNDCDLISKDKGKYFPFCTRNEGIFPIYYYAGQERKVAFFNSLIFSQYYGERVSLLKSTGLSSEEKDE